MLQNILLDLRIGCSILELGHIHIFQRELNPNLFRVDLSLGKQDNCLHVICMRKHIDGLYFFDLIAVSDKKHQISCKSFGVAGHIHNGFRCELYNRFQELYRASAARRIHYNNIVFLV